MFKRKHPCVRQHDASDCGAASLATICMHYGLEISITKIRDVVDTDIRRTNLQGIVQGGKKLGIESKAIRIDRD